MSAGPTSVIGKDFWETFDTVDSPFTTLEVSGKLFDSTIPVVDLKNFHNQSTRQEFINTVSAAFQEVGFFAVVNTGIDEASLEKAYDSVKTFFQGSLTDKQQIFNPALNGQRGYVPSETAQGHFRKDLKEFIHIGRKDNLWPDWIDLQNPIEALIKQLDQHCEALQQAFSLALYETEDFLGEMTREGECLLRALHYPATNDPDAVWAAEHTDIDLFTILPMATQQGLQIYQNNEWKDVKVPPNSFIVNCGDKLQNLSNGLFKSCLHRVVARAGVERYSIVYFVHPRDEDSVSPTFQTVLMSGTQSYPDATSKELLACRLRELGLATEELRKFEEQSGILYRIEKLVIEGEAADPVKRTYEIWKKSQSQSG